MATTTESVSTKEYKVDAGKTKKKRRRSSHACRRSSIGIPGILAVIQDDIETKNLDDKAAENVENLLSNCFETALKNSFQKFEKQNLNYDTSNLKSQMHQIYKEVILDMRNESDVSKAQMSSPSIVIQEIDGMERNTNVSHVYIKKLQNECKDWDRLKGEITNDEFLTSDLSSDLKLDTTKSQEDSMNCKQLLHDLNIMKENLLIGVNTLSTEVNSQVKRTYDIQETIKTSKNHRSNFIVDKVPSSDIKQLILEMPLDFD